MSTSNHEENVSAGRKRSFLYRLLHNQLPLESETCLFIFVNVLDYFVTYILLYLHIGHESNPIARWFLEGWGPIRGMLYYKLILVVLVCGIAQIVVTQRPRTARMLLIGGSIVVGGVVVYSLRLLGLNMHLIPHDQFGESALDSLL